ncbi:hypothetical protein [Prescottella subtropica]|uniref:hypothetical protein n=1 Tax=Prescottella subtropica TaxID=2545757 RepID=UPI0010F9529B|nr:hypothetical protein [Prescottella subtropica]
MTTTSETPLRTWVSVVAPTAQIANACEEFGLTTPQILLVLATRGGAEALHDRMVTLGLSRPTDKKPGLPHIVHAVEETITGFASEHPEHLLARSGTGRSFTAVDDTGARYTVWAMLEPILTGRTGTTT